MSLDLWFRRDIAHILLSKEQAAQREMFGERLAAYLAAINDLRVVFGINPQVAEYGPVTLYLEREDVKYLGTHPLDSV